MSDKTFKPLSVLFFALVTTILFSGCHGNAEKNNQPVIGLLLETLKEERWQKDRDYFVAAAEKLGAKVIVQSCNGSDETQIAQAENMITQGVDILVVVPHNTKIAATIVNNAHKNGVKVIGYDRIVNDCDLDLYISFDNEQVGELQAQYLAEHAPSGNYILIGGSPVDFNAKQVRKGQLKVLQALMDAGKIKIVADQWAMDWQPIEALKHTENALTKNNNDVVAVVTSNDGTAGGAIQALQEQKLAGKVWVSGQDADLAACQRVVAGTQSMTVYKPIQPLAQAAAEAALLLIQNKPVPNAKRTVNNGQIDVPSILLTPVTVDKSNLMETVIKDGYQKKEEVYKVAAN
ncbi:MAG: D-xylose ABC transporter substrate-binding protein [Bacteroidetes bacterium]|nr:D-xylose ABC transporter substrate-binding protein [Bacteroidota bacterium]